ncbi:hypothetical protein CYMTET_20700 [Cymbomonas tetramitiformis]|uniref:Uncharacterized protein n=1 Tax=Cymbomonas tetramitiformis TaxID=36881 RepID=A0AAE0G3M4_9CHLO|nr:hypothetical protein CYMTET_20700 [Cymbomonas tetramitiformis]|eukprot:gene4626-5667_t
MFICEDCYFVRKWTSSLSEGWEDKRKCVESVPCACVLRFRDREGAWLPHLLEEGNISRRDSTPNALQFSWVRNYPYPVFYREIPQAVMLKEPTSTKRGSSHFYVVNDQGILNHILAFDDLKLTLSEFGAAKLLATGEVVMALAPATFVHTETPEGEEKMKVTIHTAILNAGGVLRLPDDYSVNRRTWGVYWSDRAPPQALHQEGGF